MSLNVKTKPRAKELVPLLLPLIRKQNSSFFIATLQIANCLKKKENLNFLLQHDCVTLFTLLLV